MIYEVCRKCKHPYDPAKGCQNCPPSAPKAAAGSKLNRGGKSRKPKESKP